MDHKTQHHECRDGETFLGNADAKGFAACGWKSKRLGNIAYDVQGGVIPASSGRMAGLTPLKPLFVSTEEIGGARKFADV
jgi:hypothetical protein